MVKIVSLEFLAGGAILLLSGIHESNSIRYDIFRFFTGLPTDKAIWLLAGGTAGIVFGLIALMHAYRAEVKYIYGRVMIRNINK